MTISAALVRKLENVPLELKEIFLTFIEEAEQNQQETVTKDEFRELWNVVHELSQAQNRTEKKVSELTQAQKKTEEEIRKMTGSIKRLRETVGGISRSVSYALENETYRKLPPFLKENYIDVIEKNIRLEIKGKEINLFSNAEIG